MSTHNMSEHKAGKREPGAFGSGERGQGTFGSGKPGQGGSMQGNSGAGGSAQGSVAQGGSAQGKPELLAPAGGRAAFEAAVAAGADAVYLGGSGLNARRNADNFTTADLRAATRDAHLHGCAVYLAANTLVMPGEMDEALALVVDAADAGIDAAIIQDMGLAALLRRELPQLPLHASTQMNIRGPRGLEIARKMGFSRATLARELSVEQVARLAREGLELEVFAHGALCICESGQCLFSSMVGGRSANRGVCAQPCRLPYALVDENGRAIPTDGEFLLSPKDLNTLELLPRLVAAGVASLKIEGRMKSPEYVSSVTAAYRAALDRACAAPESFAPTDAERAQVAEAFTRGFTGGYLAGVRGADLMGSKRPNNRGVAVGRVAGFAGGRVRMKATQPIVRGDLLEIWTQHGRVMHEAGAGEGDVVEAGRVELRVKGAVSTGDRVFRVRSAALREACGQRTAAGWNVPLDFTVHMEIGEPLEIAVRDGAGVEGRATGEAVEPARTKAVSRDDVVAHVGRLGATCYTAASWDVQLSEGAGIGFSALHKLRESALAAYEERKLAAWDAARRRPPAAALDFSGVVDMSEQATFTTRIDFSDTDIACELEDFEPGRAIGPKLYATNLHAVQAWAALGASFVWLSPELTIHQMKLIADGSPLPLGLVVSGRQELMVSGHCFLTAAGPCDGRCAKCTRRRAGWRLRDRKGYEFPITCGADGRGHLYNAVPLDVVHAVPDLLGAGVVGFAVDTTLMGEREAEDEFYRVRRAVAGKPQKKREDTTSGHVFRPVA